MVLENVWNLRVLEFHLPSLEHICIINSSVSTIEYGESAGIRTLWLENTGIDEIVNVSLPLLEEMYLGGNNTERMKGNSFPLLEVLEVVGEIEEVGLLPSPLLRTLVFRNTSIYKHPPSELFPALESLTVENNNYLGALELVDLTELTELTIAGPFYRLVLSNTRVQTLCDLDIPSLLNLTLLNNPALFSIRNNNLPNVETLRF